MRHRSKKKVLSRVAASRQALYRQLAINLIMHGRMTTTLAKAKAIRPFVERAVTTGKANTLTARRLLLKKLANDTAVKKVLADLSPKYASRAGGYTRITKLGRRQGDASPTAIIEFV
ncbi:MAG: 50S ribosomal protein L17 [Candidatus Kerfeldbacteria bacterium]|nr:50S ribosomal protein L17 [Candidatus Kerfeldbacteria bacterium]